MSRESPDTPTPIDACILDHDVIPLENQPLSFASLSQCHRHTRLQPLVLSQPPGQPRSLVVLQVELTDGHIASIDRSRVGTAPSCEAVPQDEVSGRVLCFFRPGVFRV